MALSRIKVWVAERLNFSDLNAEFNNLINGANSLISPFTADVAAGGFKITGLGAGTARTDTASLATIQDGTGVYVATVGGTADAITLTPSPAITAYAAGKTFRFIASGTNTTAVTVAVSSLATRAVTKNGSTALVAGDISSGALVEITDDGTRFQLGTVYASGIFASIIDAAGDLIVGTAADTAGILPASASPAAHATTCNIWAARYNTLTGGIVTFTDVADAPYAGAWSVVVANAAHIFTDGANIEVMGNANYTCTAGDVLLFTAKTTTTFQMSVLKEDGKPVVGITLGTEQASTSGTSIDFTGIPSGVKRITIMFNGTSTSGTSPIMIQIGDSGGVETSGYNSNVSDNAASTNSTAGFIQLTASVAAGLYRGTFVLDLEDSSDFTWIGFGNLTQDGSAKVNSSAGGKALSATLDRVRITTVNGSDTFDAGAINISYQS